jgi:hypothetical protein
LKKIGIVILILSLISIVVLTGCQGLGYASGSGKLVNRNYDFSGFNSLEINNSFEYEITQSNSYNVSISCRENIVPYLDIRVSGKKLIVGLKPGFNTHGDLNAEISVPEMNRLEISGASKGSARGFKSTGDLSIAISGASQLDTDIEAGQTDIQISGSSKLTGYLKVQSADFRVSGVSRCELSGSAGNSNLEVSGASQVLLKEFGLKDVDLDVSGASTAVIKTDGLMNLDISGASTLEYYGNPTLSKVSVTGASKIKSKS